MKPAISVIVPFYNIEQYVSYCLDSILAQTFRDFELICINDGSKDGTRELLDAYAEKDSRVKVIHQENQGLSAARNNGLQLAAGKYIAFIDGDDAVTPEYLEILYSEAEKSGADFAFCDYAKTEADQKERSGTMQRTSGRHHTGQHHPFPTVEKDQASCFRMGKTFPQRLPRRCAVCPRCLF